MKKVVSFNLDEEIIKLIDKKRGRINRSVYINDLLIEIIKKGLKGGIKI